MRKLLRRSLHLTLFLLLLPFLLPIFLVALIIRRIRPAKPKTIAEAWREMTPEEQFKAAGGIMRQIVQTAPPDARAAYDSARNRDHLD